MELDLLKLRMRNERRGPLVGAGLGGAVDTTVSARESGRDAAGLLPLSVEKSSAMPFWEPVADVVTGFSAFLPLPFPFPLAEGPGRSVAVRSTESVCKTGTD